jgi:type I restriction enzyme S subunit
MSWQSTKLSEFLSERDGRIKYETANQLGLQRIKKIDFSGNIHLSQETDSKTDMIRVKSGDLVISGINAAKGAIAVHAEEDDVLATIHYSAYEFNSDKISVDFLKWFFKSPEFTDLLREQIPGGIKTELKPKHILPLEIKLPKLSEQISIEERLNGFYLKHLELEHEIDHQQSLLTKLKKAILQEAIQGKLTADWRAANPDTEPTSELLKRIQTEKTKLIAAKKLKKEKPLPPIKPEEIPFEIPEGWVWCRLGNILNFSSGDGLTAAQMAGGEIPVFGGNGINGYHDKANIETETIVVGRVGANCGAVHKTPAKAWVTDNAFITTFSESCLTMNFLILLLHFLDLNHLSYDGSQPVISGKRVYPLPTPLPPLAEQATIVERVEQLMATCRELETEIENSRTHASQLLQAILKEAFAPAS